MIGWVDSSVPEGRRWEGGGVGGPERRETERSTKNNIHSFTTQIATHIRMCIDTSWIEKEILSWGKSHNTMDCLVGKLVGFLIPSEGGWSRNLNEVNGWIFTKERESKGEHTCRCMHVCWLNYSNCTFSKLGIWSWCIQSAACCWWT